MFAQILGVVASLLVSLFLLIYGADILRVWRIFCSRLARGTTGFRDIGHRDDASAKRLTQLMDGAGPRDGFLVVARTHHGLMRRFQVPIVEALCQRGVAFRFVALHPETAAHTHTPPLDAHLGVPGGQAQLCTQTRVGLHKLAELVVRAASFKERPSGSIFVRVTDLFIENSVIAFCADETEKLPSSPRKLHLIYDVSFGFEEQKKYIVRFATYHGREDFANHAYKYSERIFTDALSRPAFSFVPGRGILCEPEFQPFINDAIKSVGAIV